MTATNVGFITRFPEFGSTPSSQIDAWLGDASTFLSAEIFGDAYDVATYLWVAHNIAIGLRNQKQAAAGGIPGESVGPTTSKSVGQVSKSMDVGSISSAGAGWYNSTSYGQRLYRLIQAAATGPFYAPGISPFGPPAVPDNGFGNMLRLWRVR